MLNVSQRRVNKNSLTWWYVLKTSWRYLCKTSWRRLEDVLKTSWRRLEDVLKTSWRRLEDIWPRRIYWSWPRRLENIWPRRIYWSWPRRLENIWPRRIYWSWPRRLEDVFWRRKTKANIFVLIKTSWRRLEDVFWRRRQKTSSRSLQDAFIKTNVSWVHSEAATGGVLQTKVSLNISQHSQENTCVGVSS